MHSSQRRVIPYSTEKDIMGISAPLKSLNFAVSGILNQNTWRSSSAAVISIIHTLQTFFIVFESTLYSFPSQQSSIEDFITLCRDITLARKFIYLNQIDGLQTIALIVICFYILCLIGITFMFLKSLLPNGSFLQKNWRNIGQFHMYCLFLPIYNILIEIIFQAFQSTLPKPVSWILFSVALLAQLVNVSFGLLHIFLALSIKTGDPLATLDNKYLKWSLIKRTTQTLLNYLVLENIMRIPKAVFNLIHLTLSVISSTLFTFTVPFYEKSILTIFISEVGVDLTFSLVNTVLSIFCDLDSDIDMRFALSIFVVITPMYLKFYANFVQVKLARIILDSSKDIADLTNHRRSNQYWFIQSIYYLRSILEANIIPNFLASRYPERLPIQTGYFKLFNGLLFRKEIDISINYSSLTDDARLFAFKFMEAWLQKYPRDNFVRIMLADLMYNDLHQPYKSYGLINHVLTSNSKINLKLSALVIREDIQRDLLRSFHQKDTEIDLSLFFEGAQAYEELKLKIGCQLEEHITFLQIIQEKLPELGSMVVSSQSINIMKSQVSSFWNSIPKELYETYLPLLLTYGVYKCSINYESKEGNEILQKYSNLSKKRLQYRNSSEISEETLFSPSNVTVLIHTNKAELGNISHCSKNAGKMFATKNDNLVGKNIKSFMPLFFQNKHDIFIMKKLQASEDLLKINYIFSFAMDTKGFVFPVNIFTTLFPWINHDIFYAAAIRMIKSRVNYILIDEAGFIDSYSKPLQKKLGLPSASQGTKVHIKQICKTLGVLDPALNKVVHTNSQSSKLGRSQTFHELQSPSSSQKDYSGGIPSDDTNMNRHLTLSSPSRAALPLSLSLGIKKPPRFSMNSKNSPYSKEIEGYALEMVTAGKVMTFNLYNEEELKEERPRRKSKTGAVIFKRALDKDFNASKFPNSTMDFFSKRLSRDFFCRVEVKRYLDAILKVLILTEVPYQQKLAIFSARDIIELKNKRPSPRNETLAFENRSMTARFHEDHPEVRTKSIFRDTIYQKLSPHTEIDSIDEIPQEKEEGASKVEMPDFDNICTAKEKSYRNTFTFTTNNIRLNIPYKVNNNTIEQPNTGVILASETPSEESNSTTNVVLNSLRGRTEFPVDLANTARELLKRNVVDNNITQRTDARGSFSNHASSNFSPLMNLNSDIGSNKHMEFNVNEMSSHMERGLSGIGLGNSSQFSKEVRTDSHKQRWYGLSNHIPTLKFYQFSENKIHYGWLSLCLVLFLVANIITYMMASGTIPVIEDNFTFLRLSMDRVFYLSMFGRYSGNIQYFVKTPPFSEKEEILKSLREELEETAYSFSKVNKELTSNLFLLSEDVKEAFFEDNIKMIETNFEDRDEPENFIEEDTFQCISKLISYAYVVANTMDIDSANFKYGLQYLYENVFNDLLAKLRTEPELVRTDIQSLIEATKEKLLIITIFSVIFFALTLMIFARFFGKSYVRTKRFLKYFVSYPQTDIQSTMVSINMFKQLLESHMQDDTLLREYKRRDHYAKNNKGEMDKPKAVNSKNLRIMYIKKISLMLVLFIIAGGILALSQLLFDTDFEIVEPTLKDIVSIKALNVQAIIAICQVSLYASHPDAVCNNMGVLDSIKMEINEFSRLLSTSDLQVISDNFQLLHQDYCYLVKDYEYNDCKNLFNGVSSTGIIGGTTILQRSLQDFQIFIDNQDFEKAINYSMDTTRDNIYLAIYIREAINFLEQQRIDSLTDNLNGIITTTGIFIGIAVCGCIAISILAALLVFIPLKFERESVCKIISFLPPRMITMNKPLTFFLERESRVISDLLRIGKY